MTQDNAAPGEVVREAVTRALAEDLGPLGDVTAALVPDGAHGDAAFVARAPGVLAGTACVAETYRQIDSNVDVEWYCSDGDALDHGVTIGRVGGPLRSVLTGERTALNFLCHLSGVATLTRRFVDAADGRFRILDTRKTLPGLRSLEKAAVRAGGGTNHRGSLSDMVLIKDNHLGALSISDAVKRARDLWPGLSIEVECERADQVSEAVAAGADIVMLDNMSPDEAKACVRIARESSTPSVLIELSGGISLDNIAGYVDTGADLVSTSVVTQSAPALDIALDLQVD
jgi:nicotinate-nucleotide pyrophosphorylase (carboxylating)